MRKLTAAAAVFGVLACSPSYCIARGAWIRTPQGRRRIEDLRAGDELCAFDPDTGVVHSTRVTAVRSAQRECIRLDLDSTTLTCTSDHPLYCPSTKQWAPAGEWTLRRRTELLHVTAEGARPVRVVSSATYDGIHEVFDVTVAHLLHNFIANDVLVHNKTVDGSYECSARSCVDDAGQPGSVDCETGLCVPPPRCALPDGGSVLANSACTCADGGVGGSVACSTGGPAECLHCGTGDGG